MKTKLITALILLSLSFGAFARSHNPGRGCNAIPSTVIAKDLNLDESSSAKLTELFKKYDAEAKAIKEKYPQLRAQEGSKLTDEQIDKNFKNQIASSREMLNLREKYYSKFRQFLTAEQVAKLFKKEKEYGNKLRDERSRRQFGDRPKPKMKEVMKNRDKMTKEQARELKKRLEKEQKELEKRAKELEKYAKELD